MEAEGWSERTALRLSRFLAGHGQLVFLSLSSGFLAFSSFWFANMDSSESKAWPITLQVVGLVLIAIGVACAFLPPTYKDLRKQLEHRKAVNRALDSALTTASYHCLRKLVPKYKNLSRISVYRLSSSAEEFELVCRAAEAEPYRGHGRGRFPLGQGLIGTAWQSESGVGVAVDLPVDKTEWVEVSEKLYNLPREVSESIEMRALNISAIRMDDSTGRMKSSGSVIVVIESMQPDLIDADRAIEIRKDRAMKDLAEIVSWRDLPVPEPAAG